MIEDAFSSGKSPIHRLDPRFRLAGATAWTVCIALLSTPPCAAAALGISLLLLTISRPPLRCLLSRLLAVNVFILFLWAILPFSQPGAPVFDVWLFTATHEGLALAGLITLKSNAIVLAFIALVATIPVTELGRALRRLKVPDKLAYLLVFTYRYIFVMAGEYQRMRQAMRIRGFTPRTNLHSYRTLAYLAGMVLVRGLDRSERVYNAMLCRAFTGRFRSLNGLSATGADAAFLILILAASAAIALYDLGYTLT
ncbi:cobalt ECF transporter T component CbiQ [Desulfovibrio ferrophilus]|uniref:Cobalt ABC transporter, inner membrane subunit CbiQ n=1 Tax=Desulfovibrio ferrophilus TaxID=241368 RepID=A0A2Z6AXP7_9BACT|nr:cobalt ECF transporter T component CbiQ [Desulfovibrio ferrophilus]BBD08027.1 cobalt ABC transporter, inner membrane subunit CbiQ [Desulfovibrio ferrophilus]